MSKLDRSPYVLAHPADNQGCGFHRIIRPIEILGRNSMIGGRYDFGYMAEAYLKLLAPDIVVWQRQAEPSQIENMKRYRSILPEAFFVYEIDDAVSWVPDKSYHKPYMPPNIDKGIANAVAVCDAVTVTTPGLAEHMANICASGTDIRIVPNMLGRDDFEVGHETRFAQRNPKGQAPKKHTKIRIGWGGGIGHSGDFEMLRPVFEHFGQHVEWIFLGMNPETPDNIAKLFIGTTQPKDYLKALASMDADLMIAPLEEVAFNRAKSNLRLIEAGACHYPVICTDTETYRENSPPVFAYAKTPQDWIDAIESFSKLSESRRRDHGGKMNNWARRNYCFDDRAGERLKGWLPKDTDPFEPRIHQSNKNSFVIVTTGDQAAQGVPVYKTLEEACRETQGDILYVREGDRLPPDMADRILHINAPRAASISFPSNDGAIGGFPKPNSFTGIDEATGIGIDDAAYEILKDESVNSGYATGGCILVRRAALDVAGYPDFRIENQELSLIEWSAAAAARGFDNLLRYDTYIYATKPQPIAPQLANDIAMRMGMRWQQAKADTDGIVKARQKLDMAFHRRRYRGLPTQENRTDYSQWASLFDSPGPRDIVAMEEYIAAHKHVGIDNAQSITRSSIKNFLNDVPDAKWVIVHPNYMRVQRHFIAYAIKAIEENPNAKLIYCDHDRVDSGKRIDHHFKPDLDHHYLLGLDYIAQCMAIEVSLVKELVEECDQANDGAVLFYEMALRTIEKHGRESIIHIPRICANVTKTDNQAIILQAEQKAAVAEAHARRYGMNVTVKRHPMVPDTHVVRYLMPTNVEPPKVSIIMPTKDHVDMLGPALNTVLQMTDYPNFDVLIVNNGSENPDMIKYLSEIDDPRVRVVEWAHPYNWSILNNAAVPQTDGEILCFLNDDTRVLTKHWLTEMVAASYCPRVGAVGAMLYFPNGTIQHVGVICHKGMNGHLHKHMPSSMPGYHALAILNHENQCVTGACMVVRRSIFEELGGFPEVLSHNYNDVAFCLELRRRGYRNLVVAEAKLQHYEGVTRPAVNSPEGQKHLAEEGVIIGDLYPEADPYWNPNLLIYTVNNGIMIAGLNMDQFVWPALTWIWRGEDWPYERVMVVGNDAPLLPEIRSGDAIYGIEIVGMQAKISKPPLENCQPFDIRKPEEAREIIQALGIDKIVLTQLGEYGTATLGFLTRLGVPVTYRPLNAESACMRGDLMQNGKGCGDGYSKGICQVCIDQHGSPQGHRSVMGWHADWFSFFSEEGVTFEPVALQKREYLKAVEVIFRGNDPVANEESAKNESLPAAGA